MERPIYFCGHGILLACALPVALDTGFKLSSPLLWKRVNLILNKFAKFELCYSGNDNENKIKKAFVHDCVERVQ